MIHTNAFIRGKNTRAQNSPHLDWLEIWHGRPLGKDFWQIYFDFTQFIINKENEKYVIGVPHEVKIALPIYPWINKSQTFHSEVLICWTIFSFIPLLIFLKLFEETGWQSFISYITEKIFSSTAFQCICMGFQCGCELGLASRLVQLQNQTQIDCHTTIFYCFWQFIDIYKLGTIWAITFFNCFINMLMFCLFFYVCLWPTY